MNKASSIVHLMLSKDAFYRQLGMEVVSISANHCILKMSVTNQMVNGFLIAHGGITYSLADSALAFASNAEGFQAVSVDTSIAHLASVKKGDELIAEANLIKRTRKMGWYEVKVRNQDQELVADFKGTVYITNKEWKL